jgi:hypothetical protein
MRRTEATFPPLVGWLNSTLACKERTMLRALAFGVIAAVAGRQLYKSGALRRFGDDFNRRLETLRAERGSSMPRTSMPRTATSGMQPAGASPGMGSGMQNPPI